MTASVEEARRRLAGRLLLRGEPGYEQARVGRVFNARRPDRFPAAVLLAADEDDVIAGVRLAAERGWTVSVRSGGHSWAVWSLRDDALLIDLGAMRDLAYDPASGVVSARPAVQGGLELAPFLAERGRAFPGGHCATVGLGGFLLQGGQGWDSRARGWACQSVVGVDVVTADGRLIRADAGQNPDLLWAARGAGPGFPGVITRFRLQTYPAPRAMWHDTWTIRLDDTVKLLGWLHDVLPGLDRRVEPVVAATRLPDVPLHDGADRPDGTVLLLHTTVMADSDAEALALLAPLQDGPLAGRELGHVQGRTSVLEENAAQTAQNPEGHRYAVDCTWTDASAAVLAPMLQALWSELDTEHSFSIWYGWAPPKGSAGSGGRPRTPPKARHGVLGGGQRVRGDVRDLHRPGRRREVLRLGAPPDGRTGRRLRHRRLPGRHRLHPAAGPVHVRRRVPPPGRDPGRTRPRRPNRVLPDLRRRGAERPWLR